MPTKTIKNTPKAIEGLPNNKPAISTYINATGKELYVGVAQRSRLVPRLGEHSAGGKDVIPGAAKIKVEFTKSIDEAKAKEERRIAATQPKHNKQEK